MAESNPVAGIVISLVVLAICVGIIVSLRQRKRDIEFRRFDNKGENLNGLTGRLSYSSMVCGDITLEKEGNEYDELLEY